MVLKIESNDEQFRDSLVESARIQKKALALCHAMDDWNALPMSSKNAWYDFYVQELSKKSEAVQAEFI